MASVSVRDIVASGSRVPTTASWPDRAAPAASVRPTIPVPRTAILTCPSSFVAEFPAYPRAPLRRHAHPRAERPRAGSRLAARPASVARDGSVAQQLLERPSADHRLRSLGDDVRAGARVVVAALDEQPLRLGTRARPLEREAAAQLLAVQDEDGVA